MISASVGEWSGRRFGQEVKEKIVSGNYKQYIDKSVKLYEGVDPAASFSHNATERVMIGNWWAPMGITIDFSKEKLGLSKWGNDPSQKPRLMLIASPMVTSNKRVLGNGAKWNGGAIEWKCYYILCQELSHQVCVKKQIQTLLHVMVLMMDKLVHNLLILRIKKSAEW